MTQRKEVKLLLRMSFKVWPVTLSLVLILAIVANWTRAADSARAGSGTGHLKRRVVKAASPSLEDVQKTIDAAADGDVVVVPVGEAAWRMPLLISDKGITLQGAGPAQIGVTGMSYGNSTGYWLTAIDPRVKVFVGVACFTRLQQVIQQGYAHYHAMNYCVPGMLKHFDTEAIFSLIAPWPMLQLNGDSEPSCPVDGIEILEKKVGAIYRMYGKPEYFQSVVYRNTGHIYLRDMKRRILEWFLKYLPSEKEGGQ